MEKEQVIAIRDELRDILEKKNKKVKVGKIVYYENFEVIKGDENYSSFSEKDLFVVTRNVQQDGLELTYYELYDEKYNLIGKTDENGQIQYSKEYTKKLGPVYSYLGLDKREMFLNKEDEFTVNDKPKEKLTKQEIEESRIKGQNYTSKKIDSPEPALMEEDLGLDRKSISYCQEIKDTRFFDSIPESKKFSRTAMLIYSNKLKTFMIVGINKDGKFEPYSTIECAKTTLKPAYDLDRDGSNIEEEPISGILRYKGSEELAFSIDFEGDGRVEFQELRRDPKSGKMMVADLETSTQYRATWNVEQMMSKEKNKNITDEIRKLEELGGEAKIEEIEDEENKEKVPWDGDPRRDTR